jgi:hypothetical protein
MQEWISMLYSIERLLPSTSVVERSSTDGKKPLGRGVVWVSRAFLKSS